MASEPPEFATCEICSRTILKGERINYFVKPHGERALVCTLCRARAEGFGWVHADRVADRPDESPSRRRGLALRDRLERVTARRPRIRLEREVPREKRDSEPPPREEALPTAPPPPRQRPVRTASAPPRRAARTPEGVRRRALQRFNRSEEARQVAGLIRSLGEPRVAVHPLRGAGQRAVVTVAWDLSWYQWEVGVNEDEAIQEVAKGNEIRQLPDEATPWNARADREGKLHLRRSRAPDRGGTAA